MSNIATTIEQSKELVRLGLDPKTADMNWFGNEEIGVEYTLELLPYEKRSVYHHCLPAWSLSTLLEVMPKGAELVKMQSDAQGIYYEIDYMYNGYEDKDAVTAAYEMMCWLLKQGLITK